MVTPHDVARTLMRTGSFGALGLGDVVESMSTELMPWVAAQTSDHLNETDHQELLGVIADTVALAMLECHDLGGKLQVDHRARTYIGHRAGPTELGPVFVHDCLFDPHSESWHCQLSWGGSSGAGPHLLASELLTDALCIDVVDGPLQSRFVDEVIQHLPDDWALTAAEIKHWARANLHAANDETLRRVAQGR